MRGQEAVSDHAHLMRPAVFFDLSQNEQIILRLPKNGHLMRAAKVTVGWNFPRYFPIIWPINPNQ